MMSARFMCMAFSRKKGRICIAGLLADGSGWFRPVGDPPDNGLTHRECKLDSGYLPVIGDLVEVELVKPRATCYQPENWEIAGQWHFIEHLSPAKLVDFVSPHLVVGPHLFGNASDSVDAKVLQQQPAPTSLAAIEPKIMSWVVTTALSGYPQCRACFLLSGWAYDLALTDRSFEKRMMAVKTKPISSTALGIGAQDRVMFTISLAGPFDATKRCYKLVAGVIVLPACS